MLAVFQTLNIVTNSLLIIECGSAVFCSNTGGLVVLIGKYTLSIFFTYIHTYIHNAPKDNHQQNTFTIYVSVPRILCGMVRQSIENANCPSF